MVRSRKLTAHLALLCAVVAWGIEYILIKASTETQSPLVIGFGTFLVATTLFGLHLLAVRATGRDAIETFGGGPLRAERSRRALPWALLALIGIVSTGINTLLIFGQKLTSAASASALGRTDILFTILLSALAFGTRIRKIHLAVLPLMLAGIYLVTGLRLRALDMGNTGDYLILGSTFLLSLNAFFIKRAGRTLTSFFVAFVNTAINTLAFLALIAVTGTWTDMLHVSFSSWLLIGGIGVCGYVFMGGYYVGLRHLPVLEVRLLLLLVPAVTVLAGWIALGSLPSIREAFGMPLIMIGVAALVISDYRENRRAAIPETRQGETHEEESARTSY